MARPATDVTARLREIEAAKQRAQAFRPKDRLSSIPMAELLRVRWPTLRDWCDKLPGFEDSGAFVRGGNGIEWEFAPRKTVDFLLRHFKARAEIQAKKSRDVSNAVGVVLPDAETAPSMADTKDLVNLTLTVVAATEKQRRYVLAEDLAAFIEGYNERVVSKIMGVRTTIDPNGNLPPAVRSAMDDYLRLVAMEVHGDAMKFIEERSAGFQQKRAV